ncbi:MAG: hypothetical protein ABSB15_27065 [Bryobacteraceae bacterium]|jgi:uncharacterized protein (TIGR03437 family)
MSILLLLLAGLLMPAWAQTAAPPANAPFYTADSIVNSAADIPNWFSPNTFVAIFGTNLAYTSVGLTGSDIATGVLPTILPGTNVRVLVNGLAAYPYYVSPTFVNALLPVGLSPGPATLQLEVNGIAGPAVTINLSGVAPVVVTQDEVTPLGETTVFAVRPNGSPVTTTAPAMPGETIYIFATGLGQTNPPQIEAQNPLYPAQIANLSGFSVLMNGTPLDPRLVSYVGILPGDAGCYGVIVTLPNPLPHDPEIRVAVGGSSSPAQRFLDTQ